MRKTVTLVFSDIAGSTAMGEGRDPEAIRGAMDRYFTEMRRIVERHGGIVEKFVGDAVMAAFGIPIVHEDDALRAVRAAAEMRDRLATLNDELERDWGVRLNARIGVNTGEVVAGDPSDRQTFATGDTVNTAARLEQAAPSNQILMSAATLDLVRDAVRVEPVEPLTLKGKAEPMPAFRLIEVDPLAVGRARRTDLALVGRGPELSVLQRMFDEALDDDACRLATVIGAAGVGKSRLLEEFSWWVGVSARVLRGRCLPYGEGITFFPVAEVVRAAAGITDDDTPERAIRKLAAVAAGDDQHTSIVDGVAAALDLAPGSLPIDQLNWSIRRWLELLTRSGPVVVVVDDIQWAEAALLDLIDHVARLAAAPMLVIGMARPEFLERRPGWTTDIPGAVTLRLEPLVGTAGEELLSSILGAPIDPAATSRILDTAGGNPLFLQELVGKLIDDGALERDGDRWLVRSDLASLPMPASIDALLAERIERLDADERSVLERGAVVGQVFYRGAVMEMAAGADASRLDEHLADLDRREYIRPATETIGTEDAFSFRHLLIRDAAYRRLSKGLRAKLHAAFAGWFRRIAGPSFSSHDEILGYHLEQAVSYRSEIAPQTDDDRRLAREAAEILATAGRRAMGRGDMRATANLLPRAASLIPPDDPWRLRIELDLARALNESGRQEEALGLISEVETRAREMDEPVVASAASVTWSIVALYSGSGEWTEDARIRASEAMEMLEGSPPTSDLVAAEELMALIGVSVGEVARAGEWIGKAADHADTAGDPATSARLRSMLTGSLVLGTTPARDGIKRCEQLLQQIGDYRAARGNGLANLGTLRGITGQLEEARSLIREGTDILIDLGVMGSQMGGPALRAQRLFIVETLYGDLGIAEMELRATCDHLEEIGEPWAGTTAFAELALVLCDQARYNEAANRRRAVARDLGERRPDRRGRLEGVPRTCLRPCRPSRRSRAVRGGGGRDRFVDGTSPGAGGRHAGSSRGIRARRGA